MNTKEMAERLQGTSAEAVLLNLSTTRPLSFCQGSDMLVELGLWDNDGQMSDFAYDVRDLLLKSGRKQFAQLHNSP